MKLSESWLKSHFNDRLTLNASQLGHQLTMAGLELDDLYKVAPDFSGVVIGEVVSCEMHPDADKLRVTLVNIGTETPLQIVCGAPNVRVGLKAPVATIGAVLPSDDPKGFKIKKGKLRGVESHGMLCGASELGLPDEIDGLLELDDTAPVGVDVRDYLHLDSHILDIAITPNRGDCLSVTGVVRELGVLNGMATDKDRKDSYQAWADTLAQIPTPHPAKGVQVADSGACPRYLAQPILGVDRTMPSPQWLKDRLLTSGLRTHNFLVDVTNFVLLELGQPLHAFDADKITGDICVRFATKGETFELLNEQNITLSGDELVIADDVGVLALAGIMGGKRSAISDDTTNIVLESAFFDPLTIAGRARRFGLHTDASARFERGVDFELPSIALDRAVSLIVAVAGGQLGARTTVETLSALPTRPSIDVPLSKIKSLLGIEIATAQIVDILTALGLTVTQNESTLTCIPPSHRYDLSIAEDVVEEIARIYGYDNITPTLPSFAAHMTQDSEQDSLLTLKNTLVANGYHEAVSFSFSDDKVENLLNDNKLGAVLPLANPISSDLAVMRRTLLSSLLPIVQYNLNRKQSHLRFFETGLSFIGKDVSELVQTPSLAMIAVGDMLDKGAYANRAFDFFDLKHDVETLLPSHLELSRVSYERGDLAFLHKGQSAYLCVDGKRIGWLGQLHPSIAGALDLPTVWVAQFDSEPLTDLHSEKPAVKPPSKFPQVRRDLAFLLDSDITWQQIATATMQAVGDLLHELWLFDVYQGDRLPDGKKSFAFAMTFVDDNATLDDDTIKGAMDKVTTALSQQFNAQLRDS